MHTHNIPPRSKKRSRLNKSKTTKYLEALEPRVLMSGEVLLNLSVGIAGVANPGDLDTLLNPSNVRHAYGIDSISFGNVSGIGAIKGDGTGQTIAIVDAYDDPDIQGDLHHFDVQFGLSDPSSFTIESQTGTGTLPGTDPAGPGPNDWEVEEALDVEWAHTVAPGANLMLVETNSNSWSDLFAGVVTAAGTPGVSVVSMSWGGPESSIGGSLSAFEATYDADLVTPSGHRPVAFFAATGDAGGVAAYPALSPDAVGVGGTILYTDPTTEQRSFEIGWENGGGGVSTNEPSPTAQNTYFNNNGIDLDGFRAVPDVSMVASSAIPDGMGGYDEVNAVPVYDSYNNGSIEPWESVSGTSLATPMFAALTAIGDQGRELAGLTSMSTADVLNNIYGPSEDFLDITADNGNP